MYRAGHKALRIKVIKSGNNCIIKDIITKLIDIDILISRQLYIAKAQIFDNRSRYADITISVNGIRKIKIKEICR